MKKLLSLFVVLCLCTIISGCHANTNVEIAVTTAPVFEFTTRICSGTDIRIGQIITEQVSCLHDYTLQTEQMRMIENAQVVILSGVGLEDFLSDALSSTENVIDASESVVLECSEEPHAEKHDEHQHHHQHDPHIWLSPANAKQMATNICTSLTRLYPQYKGVFQENLQSLLCSINQLEYYGNKQLQQLSGRQLITFHDGFSYFSKAFDLEILHAIEEESGSEASAAELIEICEIVTNNGISSIFTEINGSVSAANIISSETGAEIYQLDMAMSGSYFDAMYHNIDTVKEALE